MKRSEIIKKALNHELNTVCVNEAQVESMLEIFEKLGMMPPPLVKKVDDINDEGIHYRCTYRLNIDKATGDHVSNWEPEDEEK
jgi:DNA-binding Lrp family transcriptional regulator